MSWLSGFFGDEAVLLIQQGCREMFLLGVVSEGSQMMLLKTVAAKQKRDGQESRAELSRAGRTGGETNIILLLFRGEHM